MSETDVRMVVLEGVARQAKGTKPTAKWRSLWAEAIAPFSPEEVRAWCRLQWERLAADAVAEAVALASFWGVAPVAARGTPTLVGDWAWRLHKGDQQKWAHAAVTALGLIAGEAEESELADEAIHQLQRLKTRVRHKTLNRAISQALGAVAAERGLSPEALQDMVVEDADLDAEGSRAWQAGPYDLYLFLSDDGEAELAIFDRASGRALGSPPKALRQEHYAVWNEAKAVQKVLAETVNTQKARLETALESQRSWSEASWNRVFGRHPVMRHLARRLIWSVLLEGKLIDTAAYTADGLVDRMGDTVLVPEKAELRLMHPVLLTPEALRGWQHFVATRRVVQPFKQVFREVYRPRADELAVGRYSDRFTGQVVRYSQMYALLRARGWSGMGGVGPTGYQGHKDMPALGLQAMMGFRQFRHYQDRARRQVVLDRVEFYPLPLPAWQPGAEQRVSLEVLPEVAYSETMRDLALVVGVAGLGAESRLKGEPVAGRMAADEATELLSGIAEMRSSLLRELLPQLGIEGQVQIEGPVALVSARGHTFALHLVTGEVTLMPDGRRIEMEGIERLDSPLYLPHEGADSATTAILSTLVWLVQFGRFG